MATQPLPPSMAFFRDSLMAPHYLPVASYPPSGVSQIIDGGGAVSSSQSQHYQQEQQQQSQPRLCPPSSQSATQDMRHWMPGTTGYSPPYPLPTSGIEMGYSPLYQIASYGPRTYTASSECNEGKAGQQWMFPWASAMSSPLSSSSPPQPQPQPEQPPQPPSSLLHFTIPQILDGHNRPALEQYNPFRAGTTSTAATIPGDRECHLPTQPTGERDQVLLIDLEPGPSGSRSPELAHDNRQQHLEDVILETQEACGKLFSPSNSEARNAIKELTVLPTVKFFIQGFSFRGLTSLTIEYNGLNSASDICGNLMPSLCTLRLYLCTLAEKRPCPRIYSRFPNLQTLVIEGFFLNDRVIYNLDFLQKRNCPRLSHLHLGNNQLNDSGCVRLAWMLYHGSCPSLSHLHIGLNNVSSRGCKNLAAALKNGCCPQLSHLHMHGNFVGNEGATYLAKGLSTCSINYLNLSSNSITLLPYELQHLPSLTSLHVSLNQITTIQHSLHSLILRLDEFDAVPNPLTAPPIQVVERGLGELKAYLMGPHPPV